MSFLSASVILVDDAGNTVDFKTNQNSPVSFPIPAGSTGIWTWVVSKAGFSCQTGTIDASTGGVYSNIADPVPLRQPNGTAMFTGSTSPLVDVSFSGDICFIDIGDGSVGGQAVIDEVEVALETQAGCEFLAARMCSAISYINLSAGNFLFLGEGYRIRRRSPADVNALVSAFAISNENIVVDGSNGGVSFLSSNLEQIASSVWDYLKSENTLDGSMKDLLQGTSRNAKLIPILL